MSLLNKISKSNKIILGLYFCLFLLFFSFFLKSPVWISGDGTFPVSDTSLANNFFSGIYTWSSKYFLGYITGTFSGMFRLSTNLFFYSLNHIGVSFNLQQYFFFVFFSTIGSFYYYLLLCKFVGNKKVNLLISPLFIINPFLLSRLHHYYIFQGMSVLPALLYYFDFIIQKFDLKKVLLYLLFFFFILVSSHSILVLIVFSLLFLIYRASRKEINTTSVLKFIALMIIFLLPVVSNIFLISGGYESNISKFTGGNVYGEYQNILNSLVLDGKYNSFFVSYHWFNLIVLTVIIISILLAVRSQNKKIIAMIFLFMLALVPIAFYNISDFLYAASAKFIPLLKVDVNYELLFALLFFPCLIWGLANKYKAYFAIFFFVYLAFFWSVLFVNIGNYKFSDIKLNNTLPTENRVLIYPLRFWYGYDNKTNFPFSYVRLLYTNDVITVPTVENSLSGPYEKVIKFDDMINNFSFKDAEKEFKDLAVDQIIFYDKDLDVQQKCFLNYLKAKHPWEYRDFYYIFDLKDTTDHKKIESSIADVQYQKINSSEYMVNISDLKDKEDLYFLESFHKDWKIYPVKNDQISLIDKLKLLANKPLFDESHELAYDYANKWQIDKNSLLSNYSSDYYSKNNDGTINFQAALIFKPQLYFLASLLLSGLAIFVALIYVFINTFYKRKNELKK